MPKIAFPKKCSKCGSEQIESGELAVYSRQGAGRVSDEISATIGLRRLRVPSQRLRGAETFRSVPPSNPADGIVHLLGGVEAC